MNKKFLKKLFFLSSIVAPIAISTPLMLTSCANSNTETKPDNGNGSTGGTTNPSQNNKINVLNEYDTKFTENKTTVESVVSNGILKLSTSIEVAENTSIDSIINSLNPKKEPANFNSNESDNKLNFVKLMENSDARKTGFKISDNTINNSAFVFQSLLAEDVEINANKASASLFDSETNNNSSIIVTAKTKNNKEWNIDNLKTIELNLTIKHVKDLSKQIMFFNTETASKLVKSDNTENKIILKSTLNPDYQIKKDSNNPLNTISHNEATDIKNWLTKGTIPNDPTKEGESENSTLNLNVFSQLIYSDIFTTDFTNVKQTESSKNEKDNTDIKLKKEDLFPGVLTSGNVTTKVDVQSKNDSSSTKSLSSKELDKSGKPKIITIELQPNSENSWYGVKEELKNSKIILELEIPAAKLETIDLFKGVWDDTFKLNNNNEFVFTNSLNENYEAFEWKTTDDVLKWFKMDNASSFDGQSPATNKLNEEAFVKLFYKDVFVNSEFKNDAGSSSKEEVQSTKKLLTTDILPHLIDDDEIDTTVEVKDKTLESPKEEAAAKKGEAKTVEITLKPKPGYGWAALYNSQTKGVKENADKAVKFILDIKSSDALIPINALLDDKLVKTYTSKDKGDTPVYWFECNSHDENKEIKTKFNYSNDNTKDIQELVKKAVYAGPNQELKTKAAASTLWTVNDTDKFTWKDDATEAKKNKKVSYINRDFDLSNDKNFGIFKNLVINQDFINVSNEKTSREEVKTNNYLAVSGKALWYLKEEDKTKLAEQIKCSLMISTSIDTDTANTNDKNIVYYVSFRLEPRNKGNWKNSNNGNPIDIDVTFDIENAASIMKEDSTPSTQLKAGLTTPSVKNDKIEFVGTLGKDFFGDDASSLTDITKIENYFKKNAGKNGLTNASDIDLSKIKKIPEKIQGNLVNTENKNVKEEPSKSNTFEFKGTNLSFEYLSDSDATRTLNSYNADDNYINNKLMFIKNLKVEDSNNAGAFKNEDDEPEQKNYIVSFELQLDANAKTNWYWNNWNDLLPNNVQAQRVKSNKNVLIKLNLSI